MEEIRMLLEKGEPHEPANGLVWYIDARPRYRVRIHVRTVFSEWHDLDVVIQESNAQVKRPPGAPSGREDGPLEPVVGQQQEEP
jgi:hypothetical protein